jgi:hypothetical protein
VVMLSWLSGTLHTKQHVIPAACRLLSLILCLSPACLKADGAACCRGRPLLPLPSPLGHPGGPLVFVFLGGGGLQVDTFTAERHFSHQIKRHNSKVQAPAPMRTSRMGKSLSHTAPPFFLVVPQAELPDLLDALDGVSTASVPEGLLRDMEDVNSKGGAVHLREVRHRLGVSRRGGGAQRPCVVRVCVGAQQARGCPGHRGRQVKWKGDAHARGRDTQEVSRGRGAGAAAPFRVGERPPESACEEGEVWWSPLLMSTGGRHPKAERAQNKGLVVRWGPSAIISLRTHAIEEPS